MLWLICYNLSIDENLRVNLVGPKAHWAKVLVTIVQQLILQQC